MCEQSELQLDSVNLVLVKTVGKKRAKHGFLQRKRVKHGFPSILCSSKKDVEHNGCSSPLTRPGIVATADELRGWPVVPAAVSCVEFVLDSHVLELCVLGLISV